MRLELCSFFVKDVVFSDRTKLEKGILSVNPKELKALANEDGKFDDVEIHLTRPGERTRIIHIMDIVEPRIKVGGEGNVFPGFLGPPHTVGDGRTHRLSGVAVVETGEPVVGETLFSREAIVDMDGPGANYCSLSKTINVVLDFKPKKELLQKKSQEVTVLDVARGAPEAVEYNRSARAAGLKVASYLAEVTKNKEPDKVEVYELTPVSPSLPKVVYFSQELWPYIYGESSAVSYGESHPGLFATLIHPNEFMDGALVNGRTGISGTRDTTYVFQNCSLINELYRRHGKELNFAGIVIYRPGGTGLEAKERTTSYAAKLGQLLGAQGAILSWIGGGHVVVDVMLLCQKLEKRGIPSVILCPEMAKNVGESGLVNYVPEANAIVSVGNYEEDVQLPSMERVIGGSKILEFGYDAAGKLVMPLHKMYNSTNRFGFEKLTVKEY